MSKVVVVTGGNGFIGSHLVRELLNQKYEPILLLRKNANLDKLKNLNSIKIVETSDYLNKNTINKIARLSRIKLDDKESEDYIKDLNSILDWVEQLNEVNTDNVEPLSNISSSILPKREDVSNDTNSSEEILENAPDKLEGFFAVPKVVE